MQGKRTAYAPPIYPMAHQFYRELDADLGALVVRREANRRLELVGGGFIDFWSLENGGNRMRGQKYHRIVPDEAQEVPGLRHIWEKVMRATLTDYQGDAWFLGTPKRGGDFEHFFRLGQTGEEDWHSQRIPTAITRDGTAKTEVIGTNNPYLALDASGQPDEALAIAELESARRGLSAEAFASEYLADFEATDSELVYTLDPNRTVTPAKVAWADCRWRVVGIDPGGGDPTAIVPLGVYVGPDGDRIHQYGEFYRRGDVTVEMIAEYLAKLGPVDFVFVGETGGNVLTNSLVQLGFPAMKADMRREEGIEHVRWLLGNGRLTISPECKDSIKEFDHYRWSRRRDGTGEAYATRTPEWTHADAMDARRYAAVGILRAVPATNAGRSVPIAYATTRSARI